MFCVFSMICARSMFCVFNMICSDMRDDMRIYAVICAYHAVICAMICVAEHDMRIRK